MYNKSIMKSFFTDQHNEKVITREPIVEGIFYPDDPDILKVETKKLIEKAGKDYGKGNALGIISPYASFPFSGLLAAKAFVSAAARKIKNVVVIAGTKGEEKESVFLTESDYFSIPAGKIKVNKDINNQLLNHDSCFETYDIPHLEEHTIEMQLPFILELFPKASLVPVIVGSHNKKLINKTSKALQHIFSSQIDKTLFVVSSNLTNYLPKPKALLQKKQLTQIIEKADKELLFDTLYNKKAGSPELGCAAILFDIAGSNYDINIIDTTDSPVSEENSNKDSIVCYSAVSIEKAVS